MRNLERLTRHLTTIQRLRQHAISSGAPRGVLMHADALLEDFVYVVHYVRTRTLHPPVETLQEQVTESCFFAREFTEAFVQQGQRRGQHDE